MDDDVIVVQKQATVKEILDAHIAGKSGYEIAEKYGLDTEKVKKIINDADLAGKFVPKGMPLPVDSLTDTLVEPLEEGKDPEPVVEATPEPTPEPTPEVEPAVEAPAKGEKTTTEGHV